jgi:hypothetical protein
MVFATQRQISRVEVYIYMFNNTKCDFVGQHGSTPTSLRVAVQRKIHGSGYNSALTKLLGEYGYFRNLGLVSIVYI